MAKKYVVADGEEFHYPADASSLQIIRNAGGVSKLNETERSLVTFKQVTAGMDCSDMPAESLQTYLSRGMVIEVLDLEPTDEKPEVDEVN